MPSLEPAQAAAHTAAAASQLSLDQDFLRRFGVGAYGPAARCFVAARLGRVSAATAFSGGFGMAAPPEPHYYLDAQHSEVLLFFQLLSFHTTGQYPAGATPEVPINWGLMREGHA